MSCLMYSLKCGENIRFIQSAMPPGGRLVGWPIGYAEIKVPKVCRFGTVFLGEPFDPAFIAGRGSEYD